MFSRTTLRHSATGFAVLSFVAGAANAADVTVTDAKIEGGKLVITGTTAAPNTWVRLDGQSSSAFNVKSGAHGAFGFSIVYRPGDCVVGLQRLIRPPRSARPPAHSLPIADRTAGCPRRLDESAGYRTNDLVTALGSSWRASATA